MPEILHETAVEALPGKIFEALTETRGLAAWWTPLAKAEPRTGSVVEARFGADPYVHRFEITQLEPGRTVEWLVLDSIPEWNGTHIRWDLEEIDGRTRVVFGHRGWASGERMLAFCSYHWAIYLSSLKHYVEKGKGNPFPFED